MQSLSKKQVELIITDVDDARITLSHLADELIDHICCEVENLMNQGKDFEHAYEFVKQQTGTATLQKIQENTQFLIDKNYRRMKMTMKITGNISLAILGLATVMKILHLPGSSLLLMLGFIVLCLIFFPSAIYANYKEVKIKASKLLHISVLIGGILFMFGVLFKVLHLQGAAYLLLFGWILLLFVFLPTLLIVKLKEPVSNKTKSIIAIGVLGLIIFELSTMFKVLHFKGTTYLMVLGAILLVSVFLPLFSYSKFKEVGRITGQYIFLLITTMFFILLSVLLALNVSISILDVFTVDKSNSDKIVNYLDQKNQKLYADFKNRKDSTKVKFEPKVSAIQISANKVSNQIDSIIISIISASDGVDAVRAKILAADVTSINNKMDSRAVNDILVGEQDNGLALNLKQNLKSFQLLAESAASSNQELTNSISKLLDTNDLITDQGILTWEQFTFKNRIVISSITSLRDIGKRVKMVESKTIQYINTLK